MLGAAGRGIKVTDTGTKSPSAIVWNLIRRASRQSFLPLVVPRSLRKVAWRL